jgi:hypothetical protein
MILVATASGAVPASHLVLPLFQLVGQLQAAWLAVCPTVPLKLSTRACERSGNVYARFAHACSLILSICVKRIEIVGQWGSALIFGALSCPTFLSINGTGKTGEGEAIAEVVYSPTFARRSPCVTHLFTGWH